MHCLKTILSQLRVSHSSPIKVVQPALQATYNNMRKFSFTQADDDADTVINEICKGDADSEKKLRILMLEVEVMRQDGRNAPSSLKLRHWQHLIDLPTRNQRFNYLTYLFKTEKAKENEKVKKEARRKEFEIMGKPEDIKEFPDDLSYGITDQSLFIRIRDGSINKYDNYKALQAMMYGQSVVIDCSYEENMVYREVVNAAKQMTYVFGDNRIHKNPFNIHMCNVNIKGAFMDQLERNIPSLREPWFPMNIETRSYLDIFPKEQLVYLTPHCREELTEYNHDAVYIVGCMVDKINCEPLSLARAKRDGLKMAKLPLDRYLEWAPGAKKNLNINHMIPILLDLCLTGDWEYALRHIPRRKLMETKILAMQNRVKNPLLKEAIAQSIQKPRKLKQILKKTKNSLYYDDDSRI